MKKIFVFAFIFAAVGCATHPQTPEQKRQEEAAKQAEPVVEIPPNARLAEATLDPKSGSNVHGTVTFEQLPNNVIVMYNIEGLAPNQDYGFHVHETGDCSSDDGKSAGGHFVPLSDHGGTSLNFPGRYAGDFEMVHSDENGVAEGNYKTNKLTVAKNRAVIGRAVIIHAEPDDVTKPSSPRIACGVIKYKAPVVSSPEAPEED